MPPLAFRILRFVIGVSYAPDERWELVGGGYIVSFAAHTSILVFAIVTTLLAQMRGVMDDERAKLHEFFWRTYDVEVEKPKDQPKPPEPEPEPEPPPEPAPAPKAIAPKPVDDDPYKNLPPTPAKAAKVLTAEPKADEPVDMTNTIVSGDGNVVGGMQSAQGTGDRITTRKSASLDGTPGGRASVAVPVAAAPAAEDKSKPIRLAGGTSWHCPFPPEADADQIDRAVVGVQVTVRTDGTPSSVVVLSDPGHGFGRAAKNCALARQYQPALDKSGTAIVTSAPINITFSR